METDLEDHSVTCLSQRKLIDVLVRLRPHVCTADLPLCNLFPLVLEKACTQTALVASSS